VLTTMRFLVMRSGRTAAYRASATEREMRGVGRPARDAKSPEAGPPFAFGAPAITSSHERPA
jgi:hypothetical protein